MEQAAAIAEREERIARASAQCERLTVSLGEAETATAGEKARADALFSEAESLQQEIATLRLDKKKAVARANRLEREAREAAAASAADAAAAGETASAVEAAAAESQRGAAARVEAAEAEAADARAAAEAAAAEAAAQAAAAAAAAAAPAGGLTADEYKYLRSTLVALLTAPEVNDEALWSPLAVSLRLDEEEVDRIRIARRTTLMCCVALLSDPTSIAQSHPNLHNLLMLAAAAAGSAGAASAALARSATAAAMSRLAGEQAAAAGGLTAEANVHERAGEANGAGAGASGGAPSGGAPSGAPPGGVNAVASLVSAQLASALPSASTVASGASAAMSQAREVSHEWGRSLGVVPRESRETPK